MDFSVVENARIAYEKKSKKIMWRTFFVAAAIMFAIYFGPLLIDASRGSFSVKMLLVTLFFTVLGIVLFGFLAGLVASTLFTKKESAAYHKAYKAYFVAQVMARTFTDVFYNHAYGLSPAKLAATGIINTGDRYSSNDYTKGKYKNVGVEQADVHIQKEYRDSEGKTHYSTIFRGRFMFFEFPKKFSFKVMLIGRDRSNSYVAKIPRTGKKDCKFSEMETESNEFNRKFRIFAEDGFEMFYLLDPAMMTKLMEIYDAHKGRVILGFMGNELMIAINDGKDYFEPPTSSKPIDKTQELEKNVSQVRLITDFVDKLDLDRKIFQK